MQGVAQFAAGVDKAAQRSGPDGHRDRVAAEGGAHANASQNQAGEEELHQKTGSGNSAVEQAKLCGALIQVRGHLFHRRQEEPVHRMHHRPERRLNDRQPPDQGLLPEQLQVPAQPALAAFALACCRADDTRLQRCTAHPARRRDAQSNHRRPGQEEIACAAKGGDQRRGQNAAGNVAGDAHSANVRKDAFPFAGIEDVVGVGPEVHLEDDNE